MQDLSLCFLETNPNTLFWLTRLQLQWQHFQTTLAKNMLDRDLQVQQYSLFTTVHSDNAYHVTQSNLGFPTIKSRILTTEDLEGKFSMFAAHKGLTLCYF